MNRLLLAVLVTAAAALGRPGRRPGRHRLRRRLAARRHSRRSTRSPTYNFAGSNPLQLQIERGAPADVFASASPDEAQALFRDGLCSRPVTFATNMLVIITPTRQPGRHQLGLRPARRRQAPGGRHRGRADRRLHAPPAAAHAAQLDPDAQHGQLEPNVDEHRVEGRARLRRRRLRLRPPTALAASDRLRRDPPADGGRSRRCATRSAPSSAPGADTAGANAFIRRSLDAAAAASCALRLRASAAPNGLGAAARGAPPSRVLLALCRGHRAGVPRAADRRAVRRGAAARRARTCSREPVGARRHRGHGAHERVANALILGFGTPAAYLLATRRFRGRAWCSRSSSCRSCCRRPWRASACSRRSAPAGCSATTLHEAGIVLPFTEWAVVLAVTFVASPFYLRQAIAAFESVDPHARRRRAHARRRRRRGRSARIALPLAAGGLLAGWVLAFARGIGEFGATIIFAGNMRGETQTLTLADLRAARGELRRRARDRRPARRAQRRGPALLQAAVLVEPLELDIAVALRTSRSTSG